MEHAIEQRGHVGARMRLRMMLRPMLAAGRREPRQRVLELRLRRDRGAMKDFQIGIVERAIDSPSRQFQFPFSNARTPPIGKLRRSRA